MKKPQSQSGFAKLATVVALAVALVGVLGFVYWQNVMQPKSDSAKTGSTPKTVKTKVPTTTTPDTTDTDTNTDTTTSTNTDTSQQHVSTTTFTSDFMTIDNWGVKFKQPANIGANNSISYSFTNSDVFITTSRVEALGGSCSSDSQTYMPLGTLIRMTSPNTSATSPPELIRQFGDYHYYYAGPQDSCSSASQDIQTQDRTMIEDMIFTVEAK